MLLQCHSIDSDLRGIILSAGRIALVSMLLLIPLQSAEASVDSHSEQWQAGSQLAWWAPTERSTLIWKSHRLGLGGPIAAGPSLFFSPPMLSCVGIEPHGGQPLVQRTLVELEVRLQI